jgi:tetratricopeptide (TPR) repeat protein
MLGLEEQERRTREARLLVSRPEEYGEKQLEKSLLERGDPLIDLGLACYGSDKGMVGALYKKALITPNTPADARYLKGLRIACLSNQVLPDSLMGDFPRKIIGEDETNRVLCEADWDEAEALISNPEIECALLQALYERTGPFSTIPETRWLHLVHMSAKNTRLIDCRDNSESHYFDFDFTQVQEAILKLLEIAPVTEQWLFTLHRLLIGLDPHHVAHAQPDKIDHVLERWSAARLEGAVAAYREALKENTHARVPLEWAKTENNLGEALFILGKLESGTARLEEAVAAYREALQERTRARVPLQWAKSTGSQGVALILLAERRGDANMAKLAIEQIQAAFTTLRDGGDAPSGVRP